VKQNLPPAKFESLLLALVIILSASACATLPRSAVSAVQPNPTLPQTKRGPAININKATRQELEQLPGVGRGIAERIITHREQYGPFRRAEHLMMVRGISDRKFRELRTMIVVD